VNSSNKLEAVSDIAMTTVALLLSVVLVKQFLLPQPKPSRPETTQTVIKGKSLKGSLQGVDWAKNGRTLVFALSSGCHFCSESGPFFQEIAKQPRDGVKLVAVLPQPVTEGHQYLDKLGVQVDDVRQASLNSIGVRGTPTLLLIDHTGTVVDVWEGKLPPEREEEVLAVLKKMRPREG